MGGSRLYLDGNVQILVIGSTENHPDGQILTQAFLPGFYTCESTNVWLDGLARIGW